MASSRVRLMYFTDLLLYSMVSGFTNNRSRISVTEVLFYEKISYPLDLEVLSDGFRGVFL